jgi:hypothetical protein
MSLGEVWWFGERSEPIELKTAIDTLARSGLSAENALGERFYIDDNGRMPWDESRVTELWKAGTVVTVQLWASADEDVLISADRNSSLIMLDLDGLGFIEARKTVDSIVQAATALPGTRTLVVDRCLPDCGEEWMTRVEREADGPLYGADLRMNYSAKDNQFVLETSPDSWIIGER